MATQVYPAALLAIYNGTLNYNSDTFRALLLNDSASYNRSHTAVSSLTPNELTDATRIDLGAITVTDNGTNRIVVDAPDIVFPTQAGSQTASACLIYKFSTNDAGSTPWVYSDGANITTNGTNVTVTFSATDGIYYNQYL